VNGFPALRVLSVDLTPVPVLGRTLVLLGCAYQPALEPDGSPKFLCASLHAYHAL